MKTPEQIREMRLAAAAYRHRLAEAAVGGFLLDAQAVVAKLTIAELDRDEIGAERDRLRAFVREVAGLDRGDGASLRHASVDVLAQRARDALAGPTRPRDEVVAARTARQALEAAAKTQAERAHDEADRRGVIDEALGGGK
jgi:hypothetical protein